MSQENVDIVRRLYAEPQSQAVAVECLSPDVEWDMTRYRHWTDDPVFYGHDGVRTFMRNWLASFSKWELAIERAIESGDDVVVVVNDVAYVKGSEMPIRRRFAQKFTLRDGQVVRVCVYSDPFEALEAVGLREWRS